jgi:hypothetical protein
LCFGKIVLVFLTLNLTAETARITYVI